MIYCMYMYNMWQKISHRASLMYMYCTCRQHINAEHTVHTNGADSSATKTIYIYPLLHTSQAEHSSVSLSVHSTDILYCINDSYK